MATVFISYKREDKTIAAKVVQALEQAGLEVWWDGKLGGGDEWRHSIETQLEAAGCVVVLWSIGSTGSQGSFVKEEATRALRRRALVQVRIDDVPLPLGFGEIQALDLIGWNGKDTDERFRSILGAVTGRLEGGSTPQQPAVPSPKPPVWTAKRSAALAAAVVAAGLIAFGLQKLTSHKPDAPNENPSGRTTDTSTKPTLAKPTDTKPAQPTPLTNSGTTTQPILTSHGEPRHSATSTQQAVNKIPEKINTGKPEPSVTPPPNEAENGLALAEAGNCSKALPLLENEVAVNPSNVSLFLYLGRCQNQAGNFSAASRSLTSALELSPARADLFAERAKSFLGQRLYKRALDDLDQALKRNPGNLAAMEVRGDVFMQLGQYEDAVGAYYEVYQRGQTHEVCNKLAQAYRKNGADDLAAKLEGACR